MSYALLGAVGAAPALLFVLIFRVIGYFAQLIEHQPVLLATLGGLSIGSIATAFPQTLFFGEREIQTIFDRGASLGIAMLLMISVAKTLAIGCTLYSGFRGGFIFPLFYMGATMGLAISLGFSQIHPTIAMVCIMASVNVAVTKTSISTTVILSVLSDAAIIPVIASFVSFLLTSELSLIKTQRSRMFTGSFTQSAIAET
jgi:H+/Cl- antiporter ClcA